MSTNRTLTIIIDDQIRDQRFTQQLQALATASEIIDQLIKQHGLPQYDLSEQRLPYVLIRTQTGQALAQDVTLQALGVSDGEELQLISPQARLIWKLIEKLKEELEDYLADKLEELAREKLEELREALRKTKTQHPEAQQLAESAVQARGSPSAIRVLIGVLLLGIVIVVAILVWNNPNRQIRRTPGPPEPVGECWCEGPNLHCDDGRVFAGHPECGGVECGCEGPDLVCSDGRVEQGHPECEDREDPPD